MEIQVKYNGPAKVFTLNGKDYKPGDTFKLSEAQLKLLATPPAGRGVHSFEFVDQAPVAPKEAEEPKAEGDEAPPKEEPKAKTAKTK